MKKYFLHAIFISLLMILFICLPVFLQAQGTDPGCDPSYPGCPIDGGLIFLLVAGAGYGVKKIKDSRKKDASAF